MRRKRVEEVYASEDLRIVIIQRGVKADGGGGGAATEEEAAAAGEHGWQWEVRRISDLDVPSE